MIKMNSIKLSLICGVTLSFSLVAQTDFSYHAEIPKDNKVSTDYLEKRKKALTPDADRQRQLEEAQARYDAEAARRESEKRAKCERQKHRSGRRIDRDKGDYYAPPPCFAIY